MSEKQSKVSRAGGKRPGAGRPKGSIDKGNALIREMIVEALHGVGGVSYLMEQAREKPVAFLGLVGKVMPVQVQADIDANVATNITVTFK